jgi:8-oxo-dGTP pyrophosphatase MutT (NUDIX family)
VDPATRLPAHLAEHALAYEDGTREAAEPRHAATVVLLRQGAGGPGSLHVYLLRRHVDMAFAAGMCVFPGGRVDPRDFETEVGWVGPSPAEWAERLGCEVPLARALVCAAVRETFEESGVLLAGPSAEAVVADTTGADWEEDRHALESREASFTDFLARRGLVLRTDLLRLWGVWVTPAFEPRRYDTRFFLAELPAGQVTRDVSTESDQVTWLSVGEALDAVDDQQMMMMPPTYITCAELYPYDAVADALAAAPSRDLTPVMPTARPDDGGGAVLSIPDRLVDLTRDVATRRGRA